MPVCLNRFAVMPFLYLLFAFLLGAAVCLSSLLLLPRLFDKWFRSGKKKVFKVVFRLDYYQQPSLFTSETKGTLIKSPPIAVKIAAKDRDEALHVLDDLIKEETRAELVSIKELMSNPENIETLKDRGAKKPDAGVIKTGDKA